MAAELAKKTPQVVLLSFPAELLSGITDLVDDVDLYPLSQTCRILHHIALHALFNRCCKAVFTRTLIVKDPPPFILPALHSALFIEDVRRIGIVFPADVQGFYTQARVLTQLINRLPWNDVLDINLALVGKALRDTDAYIDPEELTSVLQYLMDAALKKGCTHLHIRSNPWLSSLYSGRGLGILKKNSHRVSAFVKQLGGVFSGKNSGRSVMNGSKGVENDSSPSPPTTPSVKNVMNGGYVTIATDLLLEPFFLDWTLNLLNHSGITKLCFTTKHFKPKALQQFLPKIYIPRLEWLTLNAHEHDFQLEDVAQFLQRHSTTLFTVAFATDTEYISPGPKPSSPLYLDLPKLFILELSSYYVPWFLETLMANPTKAIPPILSEILITASPPSAGAPTLNQTFKSFAEFTQLGAATVGQVYPLWASRLTLDAKRLCPSQFVNWLARFPKRRSGIAGLDSISSVTTFPSIREFHLEIKCHKMTPVLEEKLYKALGVFLALFPNLSRFRLRSAGLGKPSDKCLQSLKGKCLKLRTVRVNSDEASLNARHVTVRER
ncbi:hypothetical protein BDN72DRAFT_495026 [Pluteus cervinus]|uniref:Uncharacterized protein n=1 Tax=Pluteus cervinus TaxID=181527 RepID=A0ACD3B0Z4_9AGAR|nr:hypothetical protein BDN72DRAFT_495026 [Pluteus cervinus]